MKLIAFPNVKIKSKLLKQKQKKWTCGGQSDSTAGRRMLTLHVINMNLILSTPIYSLKLNIVL